MKKIMSGLLLAVIMLVSIDAISAAPKERKPFPKEIIDLVNSNNFTFSMEAIVGIPPTTMRTPYPISYVVCTPKTIDVYLPYYTKTGRQTIYSFSTFGKMLDFDSNTVTYNEGRLNKKGTIYEKHLNTYSSQYGGQYVTMILTVTADNRATMYVSWGSRSVSYTGTLSYN